MDDNYKIIGIDFDGTLATIVRGEYPKIGEPIMEVIDYIKKEQANGSYIILITMREGLSLDMAISWCKDLGLNFDSVNDNAPFMKEFFKNNPRKIFCNEYLDDSNLGGIDLIIKTIRERA